MNFITSVLLDLCDDEEHTVLMVMIYFIQSADLKMEQLFINKLHELQVMTHSFDHLIQKHCPRLNAHFK
jgi:hypothetical protein